MRDGVVSEEELLAWCVTRHDAPLRHKRRQRVRTSVHRYHGHIGRALKLLAAREPPRHRLFAAWLTSWGSAVLCDLAAWSVLVCSLLLPALLVAMVQSVAGRYPLQFSIQWLLFCLALLMLVVEVRSNETRRFALHVARYVTLIMQPAARGVLYILIALALLAHPATDHVWMWVFGYALELLGIAHLLAGGRVNRRLRQLRGRLPSARAMDGALA